MPFLSDITPAEELALRHTRALALLAQMRPEAGGLLVFGRVNIYYFTGSMGSGIFWLPREGRPLLLVRKGLERARLDSPYLTTVPYRSYNDLAVRAKEHGTPLAPTVAAEQSELPWALAASLQKRLPNIRFVSADAILARVRSIKSPWELTKMRQAGMRHAKSMEDLLPKRICQGMSELDVAHTTLQTFLSEGSCGIIRMNAFGEELYLGDISAGENGNYPSFYNGPMGCRGMHPAAPFLGHSASFWARNSILTLDAGFCFAGYHSDKTVIYFAGARHAIPATVKNAYATCLDIEDGIQEQLRPGALPSRLYELALRMAKKAGFTEGFMGLNGNKVPFLGHSIGLCVDEWPVLAKNFNDPLEPGMTLAVEPKIGLAGIGMVGRENTWEITDTGAVCLSGRKREILCME